LPTPTPGSLEAWKPGSLENLNILDIWQPYAMAITSQDLDRSTDIARLIKAENKELISGWIP
jgi:hypothetical protein